CLESGGGSRKIGKGCDKGGNKLRRGGGDKLGSRKLRRGGDKGEQDLQFKKKE
ncbi:hypothetical protein Tco_0594469, partial [Tanacetum coccineum]